MLFRRKSSDADSPAKGPCLKRHCLAYKRRWLVYGGLFLSIGFCGTYYTLTRPHRLRAFLERELTSQLGGKVTVENASFSPIGGLVVKNVTLEVDEQNRDDSRLLVARHLNVVLDWSRLLQLKLDLARVEAEGVQISLCEDPKTSVWNLQRLLEHPNNRSATQKSADEGMAGAPTIPSILIRDATVRYFRRSDGNLIPAGQVRIDASIVTMPERRFGFHIVTDPLGQRETTIIGMLDRERDEITGKVTELNFNHALRAMLPSSVRDFFDEFDFSGRFSIPSFRYNYAPTRAADSFDISLAFADTRATIQPRHWLNGRERWNMRALHTAIDTLEMAGVGKKDRVHLPLGEGDVGATAVGVIPYLQLATRSIPLYLTHFSGNAVFSDHQIELKKLSCQLQGQSLEVTGHLLGYDAEAPGKISIRTRPGTYIDIPPSRQFMSWLPEDVRKAYLQFKPRGKGTLDIQLSRETPHGPLDPVVVVGIHDATMEFDDFPYPLRGCVGKFIFSHDTATDKDLLRIDGLRGYGVVDGPNARSLVQIDGTIGPFSGPPGIDVTVTGTNISSEPALRKSFPREVAKAMLLFGPPDYGKRLVASGERELELNPEESIEWPRFFGDFRANIHREPGERKSVDTNVRLDLKRASGCLKVFPYPMNDLSCVVKILNDQLTIENLRLQQNGADLTLNGTVGFGDPTNPDIHVDVRNVAMDADLLNALPPTERYWVEHFGLGGRVDINGRVFLKEGATPEHAEVDFGLNLKLHDAVLMKDADGPAFTSLNGDAFLRPARLEFREISGERGEGTLKFSGALDWQDHTPDIDLKLSATNLLLDKSLHDMLPESVQESWDKHRPEGTTDLDLDFVQNTPPGAEDLEATTRPVAASTVRAAKAKDLGSQDSAAAPERLKLSLRPRKMAATSDVFPYRLDDLAGEIVVDGEHVRLIDLKGRHGDADVQISADGRTSPMDFNLKVLATGVQTDAELLKALPSAVSDVISGLKIEGAYAVRFDKLHVRQAPAQRQGRRRPSSTQMAAAATQPATPTDVDFSCVITTADGKIDIGVPVNEIAGWTQLIGEVRDDALTKLDGDIDISSYSILDRHGSNLTAKLHRPQHESGILLQSIRSDLSGGSLSGDLTILTPEDERSQYAVSMNVQNVDLAEIVGGAVKDPVNGKVSANFDVEGILNDPANRRGRGRIEITGEGMYEAPIVLGVFRLVNFALPVREGVKQVEVSYTLLGDRATFDSIEMNSPGLRIYGDGVLDFARREMDFSLNTENPNAWSIPFINALVRRAREELLQIRIRGSIAEPAVQARTFPTFQATLDQVVEDVRRSKR